MLNLKLDCELASTTLRPTIGNWQFMKDGQTWADYEAGTADVIRTVRVQGRKYWITAGRAHTDGFANLIHQATGGRKAKPMYTYFNIHSVDPRIDPRGGISGGFGTGMINRLPKVLRQAAEFHAQLKSKGLAD